jgi:hypothetical protein
VFFVHIAGRDRDEAGMGRKKSGNPEKKADLSGVVG